MSASPGPLPSQQAALVLHQRLLAQDPTAARDAAAAYLESLIVWLAETNRRVPEDIRIQAAEDAILALIRRPESYCPGEQTLKVYLRMSARGDLRNILHKEARHNRGRTPWKVVELSPDAGKYLGRADDPSLSLCVAEERQRVYEAIPDSVTQGLSETDRRALALIVQKERRTAVFAELYGLQHLPAKEQRTEVKRHKDRLKNLLKRAGRKA
jgi:hypothetical protein